MTVPRNMRVFKASVPDPERAAQPITFGLEFLKLDAHGVPTGDVETLQLEALADPGAGASLAVSKLIRYDERGNPLGLDITGLMVFFERVLLPGDYARLATAIDHRQDLSITMEQLGDAYRELMEEYAGRPTRPSSVSSNGVRSTGQPLTEMLSNGAPTSPFSPSPAS